MAIERLMRVTSGQRKQHRAARHADHERRLQWLLDFADSALPVSAADWRNLQGQLQQLDYVSGLDVLPAWMLRGSRTKAGLRRLSRVEIHQIHDALRGLLDKLKPAGEPPSAEPYELLPARVMPHLSSDGRRIWAIDVSEWPDTFWLSVRSLLARFGERLTRCEDPQCGRLFLRTRRQSYCSRACSQRVRQHAWYQRRRKEVLARRKVAYEARVKAQLWPNVLVAKREGRKTHATKKQSPRTR
jgi:hypothetical protein